MITEPLKSLAGNRIVTFYSWNEEDHNKAQEVATLSNALLPRKDIEAPHLLAGATQAAYDDPAKFQEANDFLNAALLRRATKNTAYQF